MAISNYKLIISKYIIIAKKTCATQMLLCVYMCLKVVSYKEGRLHPSTMYLYTYTGVAYTCSYVFA